MRQNPFKVMEIVASTRPERVGRTIAQWFHNRTTRQVEARFEITDLVEWNLPFLDEPLPPKMNLYQHDHTLRWSQKVSEADGFVIITPEYNRGYPASLKNALDYLYREWAGKPVAFVSYGIGGGRSAVDQLHQVVAALHMNILPQQVAILFHHEMFDERRRLIEPEVTLAEYSEAADSLIDSFAEVLSATSTHQAIPQTSRQG